MLTLLIAAAAVQVGTTGIVPGQVSPAANWRAAPLNAGTWSYRPVPGGSEAVFQDHRGPQLTLRCNLATRQVTVVRTGLPPGFPVRVVTTSLDRVLPATNTLAAGDSLLDAVAFSRGRFAVYGGTLLPLIVPAWPEAARSVEDCRK